MAWVRWHCFPIHRASVLDRAGNVYVADTGNSVIRQISPAGLVTTFAGTGIPGSQLGPATNAQFAGPSGVCVDVAGNVYVADGKKSKRVCKVDTNGVVSLLADIYGDCYHGPGLWQLVADPAGNEYVGSWASVQQITPSGIGYWTGRASWVLPGWLGPERRPGH